MPELNYKIERMSCSSCKLLVTEELEEFAGVDSIDIDLANKLVTVRGSSLDDELIRTALDGIGYSAIPA